jgi:hypothetical protein
MSQNFVTHDGASVLVVEPGFNAAQGESDLRSLTEPANPSIFDPEFMTTISKKKPFIMVLGAGFETAETARGFINLPCKGLASVEQLRFLQDHGLTTIVMSRMHGTLVQNARAIGLEVVVGGQNAR